FSGQFADLLRARDENFVFDNQLFELIEKPRENIDNFLCALQPTPVGVDAASAESHVVAHHARAGEGFEQIENFLALAERIHEWRAPGAHVAEQKPEQRSVILKP